MLGKIFQDGLLATFAEPLGNAAYPLFLVALLLCPIVGYLLGSLNSAILISRLCYGEDIRTKGSGNAGLTNMLRTYGKRAAGLTMLGDIAKTALAVTLGGVMLGFLYARGISWSYPPYIAGFFCVIGHIKPVYYGFRGGKGVLCTATVVAILAPIVFLVLFCAFILILWATKFVSLGSIVCAGLLPLALQGYMQIFLTGEETYDGTIVLIGFSFAAVVIICHRANLLRLWRHEESKFSLHPHNGDSKDDKDGKKK